MASNGEMGLLSRNKEGFARKDLSPTQQVKFDQLKRQGGLKKSGKKYRLTAATVREIGG